MNRDWEGNRFRNGNKWYENAFFGVKELDYPAADRQVVGDLSELRILLAFVAWILLF